MQHDDLDPPRISVQERQQLGDGVHLQADEGGHALVTLGVRRDKEHLLGCAVFLASFLEGDATGLAADENDGPLLAFARHAQRQPAPITEGGGYQDHEAQRDHCTGRLQRVLVLDEDKGHQQHQQHSGHQGDGVLARVGSAEHVNLRRVAIDQMDRQNEGGKRAQ